MSKIIAIADRLGRTPAAVYKMIGRGTKDPEARAILTEELGKRAGEAYDPDVVIEVLKKENAALVVENHELRVDNERHVRGTHLALRGAMVVILAALCLASLEWAPRWAHVQVERVHANERLRQENAHLREKAGWLARENKILIDTNEFYKDALAEIRAKTERMGE